MIKISVIITSFNSETFIESSVNSVLNQSYQNFELIIVDDCSKDKTQRIINKLQKKDKRIKTFFFKKILEQHQYQETKVQKLLEENIYVF